MKVGFRIGVWLSLWLVASSTLAEDWPQWRGPAFNGTSSETGLPVKWSETENVAWTAPMPGISAATPIVSDKHVFATASEPESQKLWAICLSRKDGKVLWTHDAGTGFSPLRGNTASSSSPIVDGDRVYFYFGTGRLMAFKVSGEPLWDRKIAEDHGKFMLKWGYSSSPLLFGGRLYVPVIHGYGSGTPPAPSYLLCIDPKTGKDLWKHVRETGAKEECLDAYTTPHPFTGGSKPLIIVNGSDHATAHDAETGKEAWRSDNYNTTNHKWFRTITSCTSWKDLVIVPVPKVTSMFAVKGNAKGLLERKDRVWTFEEKAPDVCVPLVYDGNLFVLAGNKRVMTCRDPRTGKERSSVKLERCATLFSSPTGADGKIYCQTLDGEIVILSADKELKILNRIKMNDASGGSSVAVSGGQLFIRTNSRLTCIGVR